MVNVQAMEVQRDEENKNQVIANKYMEFITMKLLVQWL